MKVLQAGTRVTREGGREGWVKEGGEPRVELRKKGWAYRAPFRVRI